MGGHTGRTEHTKRWIGKRSAISASPNGCYKPMSDRTSWTSTRQQATHYPRALPSRTLPPWHREPADAVARNLCQIFEAREVSDDDRRRFNRIVEFRTARALEISHLAAENRSALDNANWSVACIGKSA